MYTELLIGFVLWIALAFILFLIMYILSCELTKMPKIKRTKTSDVTGTLHIGDDGEGVYLFLELEGDLFDKKNGDRITVRIQNHRTQ